MKYVLLIVFLLSHVGPAYSAFDSTDSQQNKWQLRAEKLQLKAEKKQIRLQELRAKTDALQLKGNTQKRQKRIEKLQARIERVSDKANRLNARAVLVVNKGNITSFSDVTGHNDFSQESSEIIYLKATTTTNSNSPSNLTPATNQNYANTNQAASLNSLSSIVPVGMRIDSSSAGGSSSISSLEGTNGLDSTGVDLSAYEQSQPENIEPTASENPVSVKTIVKVTDGDSTSYELATNNVTEQNLDSGSQIIEIVTSEPTVQHQIQTSVLTDDSNLFPQDASGWSVIVPSQDSRLIYVSSSSGDDDDARAYSSHEIGITNYPSSTVKAFKTIGAAQALLRNGYPDWLLLKKGDAWQVTEPIGLRNGRTGTDPQVLTSYGASQERPLVKTGLNYGVRANNRRFVSIIGIDFYANFRNPDDADFVGWTTLNAQKQAPSGISFVSSDADLDSVLIEDCKFRHFGGGILIIAMEETVTSVAIRRNQILDSFGTNSHSQGILLGSLTDVLIEGNLFDHNGWYQQRYGSLNEKAQGQATFFNHNLYLSDITGMTIRDNIIARSSSIGIKLTANAKNGQNMIRARDITIQSNLFLGGEIGISAGGNTDFGNGYRFANMHIDDNVFLYAGYQNTTVRGVGWGYEISDWDGGSVTNNYMLFNDDQTLINNVSGINITGRNRNTTISSNVINDIGGATTQRWLHTSGNEVSFNSDVTINSNDLIVVPSNPSTRKDLNSYMNVNSASDNGVERFVNLAKKQSKGRWDKRHIPSEVNSYLKNN